MKKIIKSIFIFYVFIIALFGVKEAKASTITTETLDYYFTFLKDNNHNFSDVSTIYYIDGRVSYCIEPGVKLGSDYNNQGNLDHLDENKRNNILNYMYYGYLFKNHTDKKYYMATQALIWEELLINSQEIIYSTEAFKKGSILDLSSYKNEIKNTINTYTSGAVYNSGSTISFMYGQSVGIEDYSYTSDSYDIYYNEDEMYVKKDKKGLFVYSYKPGNYTITMKEKNLYNVSYNILHDDSKQDLLVVGDIPHNDYYLYINTTGGTLNITKMDMNNNPLKGAVFDLYYIDGTYLYSLTTDENGILTFNDLIINKYYVKEVVAPEGYVLDDTISYFEISRNNKEVNLFLYNEPIVGELIINKMDKDTKEVISDTSFDIYDNNMNIIDTIVTDNEGKASINLKYGKYYYKEVKNNNDYILDDTIYDIDITEPIKYQRDIYNKHIQVESPIILDNVAVSYDELVIDNVPNTMKISIIPILCLIGAIIVEEKIN